MKADLSVKCDSEEGEKARILAWVMVVIFPIGVPLVLLILLFRHRDEIMQRTSRSGEGELAYIGESGTKVIHPDTEFTHNLTLLVYVNHLTQLLPPLQRSCFDFISPSIGTCQSSISYGGWP